jgi:hypothetical protein
MKDMKPSAKRKASRRAPAKRAKSTRRTSAAKSARRSPAKAARGAPAKTVKAPSVSAKRAKIAQAVADRVLSRPKTAGAPIIAAVEIAVSAHKFRVGESVHLTAGVFVRGGANGIYKVTQLLPSDGDEQQYRIKSASEPHERVAKQSQLEPAAV